MNEYLAEDSTLISIVTNLSSSAAASNSQDVFSQGMTCAENVTDDQYKDFYKTAQYITGLIVYPLCCIIGILGNVLAIIVFRHRDMRTSTNVYLLCLSVSDFIKLVDDLMYFIVVAVSLEDTHLSDKMKSYMYPIAHYIFIMSVCVTSWLTVSVAVERFISVCYASRAKELCTIPRARFVCTCVFIVMSILAIPSALRYKMLTIHDVDLNTTCVLVVPTELGNNDAFMVPYSWIQNSSRSIIPVFILVFLNVRIINELRKERVKGKKFSARNRITLMLIVVIFMFLICVTPDAVMSTFFGKGYVEEDYLVLGVREITDSLLAVNSAFNFFLYCTMSVVFRTTFVKIFCQFKQKNSHPEAIKLNRKLSSPAQKPGTTNENANVVVRANGCTTKNEDENCQEHYL